jgi:hypothetical protein
VLTADHGDALRIYASDHPALARGLHAKLLKTAAEYAQQLATGCAQDWADYKQRIGVIRGLNEAAQMCESESQKLDGDR